MADIPYIYSNQQYQCDNYDVDDDLLASSTIEEPLCRYLGAFDGNQKEFTDIQSDFHNLFSTNLIHLMDGHPISKDSFICLNQHLLQQCMVATLEDIYFIDDTHVEYTVHYANEHVSMVTHVMALVADGKIVKIEPCEETKGVFANIMCDKCRSNDMKVNSSRRIDEQLTRIRGWAKKSILMRTMK